MSTKDDRYHLSAEDIAALDGVAKTHFLNAAARRVNRSLGDPVGLQALGVHLIEVQPGDSSTEFHRHHHEEECVYVLSGTADAHVGDIVHAVGPGDFIGYRAGGEAHMLVATGDTPLRCLVIGQRLEQDTADYPRLGKRLYRDRALGWDLYDVTDRETVAAGAGRKT